MHFCLTVKKIFKITFIFAALTSLSSGVAGVTPKRIVTLIPSLGELAAELLENTKTIVGVSEFTDYPKTLKTIATIGPYDKVSLERILALKPDLVLASFGGNSKDQVERLQELKIPTLVVKTENVGQVSEAILSVGRALGVKARAEMLNVQFKTQIEAIRARIPHYIVPYTVLLQIGDEPLVVAGRDGFLNEAIEIVGAKNVYSDQKGSYPRVSYEDVVKRNPDAILVLALHGDEATFEKMLSQWRRFPNLKAVKNGKLKILHADELLRPGIRLPIGIEKLEKAIR